MFASTPRSLGDPKLVAERRVMLDRSQDTRPLTAWAEDLSRRRGVFVPLFDPVEAGVRARVLLILEAPGPMTSTEGKRPGSGFVSSDNDDRTAMNVWQTRREVGLDDGFLSWNMVPWYLGPASVKPTQQEVAMGAQELGGLLDLLPELQMVILGGRYAQRGWKRHMEPLKGSAYEVLSTWHPSPLALNQPERRADFTAAFRRAAEAASRTPTN